MAQGDSISGSVYITPEQGDYGYFIQPPIGEVWLITYFREDPYMDSNLTNGVVVYEEPGYREFEIEKDLGLLDNRENIRLFIDHNFFILLRGEHGFWWSGVQFK